MGFSNDLLSPYLGIICQLVMDSRARENPGIVNIKGERGLQKGVMR